MLPGIASRRTCRRNARKKRKGELDLCSRLRGPLSPEGGTIGDIAPPMHSVVQQVGENELISANPLTVKFSVIDEQLALPAVAGCAEPPGEPPARAAVAFRTGRVPADELRAVQALRVTQMVIVPVTTGLPLVSVIVTGTGSSNPWSPKSG